MKCATDFYVFLHCTHLHFRETLLVTVHVLFVFVLCHLGHHLLQAANPALNIFPFDVLLDMFGFSKEWREIYLSPLLNILFLDTTTMYVVNYYDYFAIASCRGEWREPSLSPN